MFIPARIWRRPISAIPGGITKRTANQCIRETSTIRAQKKNIKSPCVIRKAPPRAGFGPIQNTWKNSPVRNSTTSQNRRNSPISIVTAGFSAPSISATAKATCSTAKIKSSPGTTPINSRRPSIWRTSISKKECTASTATLSRIRTAPESCTRNRVPRSNSTAPIVTGRSTEKPRWFLPGRPRPRAEPISTLCARRGARGASNTVRENCSSARWSTPKKNGKWCRPWTPSLPATSTTIKNRLGPGARRRSEAGARQQPHDLLCLPHLLDPELFRLPSFHDGQPAQADAAQRRPDHAKLDRLRFSGTARRRFYARNRWHGHRSPRRAGTFLVRHRGQLAESESGLDLLHAADGFRRRFQRHRVQHLCSAHRARQRNERLRRLPSF